MTDGRGDGIIYTRPGVFAPGASPSGDAQVKKRFVLTAIFALTAAFGPASGKALAAGQEKVNSDKLEMALVDEMRTLDEVFRDIVSNVVLGNNEAVVATFDHMHGKREMTEEALGAKKLHLPKNPDKVVLFKKLDGEFHGDMRMLERAARKNDRDKMLTITQRLLGRCVACPDTFRK